MHYELCRIPGRQQFVACVYTGENVMNLETFFHGEWFDSESAAWEWLADKSIG